MIPSLYFLALYFQIVTAQPRITAKWVRIPGGLTRISKGNSGVWGVNRHDHIYKLNSNGKSWTRINGGLVQVSSGASVWGVNRRGGIYKYLGNHRWQRIGGALTNVDVSNRDRVWGVNRAQNIYRWTGRSWQHISGKLIQISVGDSGVWGVNAGHNIYYRTGTFGDANTAGSGWKHVSGKLQWVASGTNLLVGVNRANDIYYRKGMTSQNPTGTGWVKVPGKLMQIDIHRDEVVGTNSVHHIYRSPVSGVGVTGGGAFNNVNLVSSDPGVKHVVGCNKPVTCDVCQPLLEYRNKAFDCRDRITKVKNNAEDVKDKVDAMHKLSKKAKSAQYSIAKIDKFMRDYSFIISKIPKVGRLVVKVSNSLKRFGDVLGKIGSKERKLAQLKARLQSGIKKLNFVIDKVDKSGKIAHHGRNAIITAHKASSIACCSIDLTASNNVLTSSVIRTAKNVMDTCATYNINVQLPSISLNLLNVIGAIADVVEKVRKWIEEIKNAFVREADYFMCCENFGRFLGDVAEVFGDLVGLVTCVESGAMGGILDESFDVLLNLLSPLFGGVNNQIRNYNTFAREFEKSVSVKVLGFKYSFGNVQHNILGCKVVMPNINPFSSIAIGAGVTMPRLSEINFAGGDGQFNVEKVFGAIAAECADAAKALVTSDRIDCCAAAKQNPWPDGTVCVTCGGCRNRATYWWSKAANACGNEPKLSDGTHCLAGTSCNRCRNRATWWYGKVAHFCGNEPRWRDGTTCGAGTSCNACQNGYSHWWGAGITKCGREPCWGRGKVCGWRTTCNACCRGGHCPWYWFGICKCK